jgi:hypothetical protein
MTLRFMATRASAILPIAMSFAALAVLAAALLFGWGRGPTGDEGAAAHLWQLLMAGQLPIIGYFVVRWVAVDPRAGAPVLAAQLAAGLCAALPVFLLHL